MSPLTFALSASKKRLPVGIEARHAYRFEFLKSEKWKTVRLEALTRERGCCQICKKYSLSNDAHHVIYPPSVWETKVSDLAILCRPCHDLMHRILEIHTIKVHTPDQFRNLCVAIQSWKHDKNNWLKKEEGRLRCVICKQHVDSVSFHRFFEKFGSSNKYGVEMCARCIDSAMEAVGRLDSRPASAHVFYEAWKGMRAFSGPHERD